MQNAAGHFVQPSEVINNYNVTEVFGDDFVVPTSLVSGAWANVSLSQSSKPPPILYESLDELHLGHCEALRRTLYLALLPCSIYRVRWATFRDLCYAKGCCCFIL